MLQNYDLHATKRPISLSINSDLLDQVKALNVNLSAMAEAAFADYLLQTRRQKWLEENAQAMADLNAFVEQNGVFRWRSLGSIKTRMRRRPSSTPT
jgi:antitoxin CcdA